MKRNDIIFMVIVVVLLACFSGFCWYKVKVELAHESTTEDLKRLIK